MASIDRDKLGEYLSAYLDGELTASERADLERVLAGNPEARALLDELRGTVRLVQDLPHRAAPPSLLADLTAAVERDQLLGDPAEGAPRQRPWWFTLRPLLSAAAVLVITVGGGYWIHQSSIRPGYSPQVDQAPPAAAPGEQQKETPSAAPLAKARTAESGRRAAGPADEQKKGVAPPPGPVMAEAPRAKRAPGPAPAGRRRADSRGAVADQGAGEVPRGRLFDSSSFRQKLLAGVAVETLAEHPFANEPNRLSVLVADDHDLMLGVSQLEGLLARQGVRRVSSLPPGHPPAEAPLYLEGRSGRNFDEPRASCYLVQIPAAALPELVDTLATNDVAGRPMQMVVGPVVASGRAEVDAAVARMQHGPTDSAALALVRDLGPPTDAEGEVLAEASAAADLRIRDEKEHGRAPESRRPASRRGVSLAEAGDRAAAEGHSVARERSPEDVGQREASTRSRPAGRPPGARKPLPIDVVLRDILRPATDATATQPADPTPATTTREEQPGGLVDRRLDRLETKGRGRGAAAPRLGGDARVEAGHGRLVTFVIELRKPPAEPSPAARRPATHPSATPAPIPDPRTP